MIGIGVFVGGCFAASAAAAWPDTPFKTSDRQIVSASGSNVVYAGVNWPGAAQTMLPEGLQYRSIADIVSQVKSLGMNVIRLTYAIEMIDDVLSNSTNQGLKGTLSNALGEANGTKVLQQILSKNPMFTETTTRLEVFDAVAAECAKQQIWVHLDNHVSKAMWCCGDGDGNAWFGDLNFPVMNWQRGLAYMANHAASWPAFASMSLRNELRPSKCAGNKAEPYDWAHWLSNAKPAMDGINAANPSPLIFISGLNYDTDDSSITNGTTFKPSDVSYGDKIVYEIHNYQHKSAAADIVGNLNNHGYHIMNKTGNSAVCAPMVMTEFGFDLTADAYLSTYPQAIKSFVTGQPGGPGGWMYWVLAGSYYIRKGIQDDDEHFGLFNHDWSAWKNQNATEEYFKPFAAASH